MSEDRAVLLAAELQLLGVSQAGIVELLSYYPHETIARQLKFLPFRKAKRPEAFIIEAIRNNYSAPKEFFYAKDETELAKPAALDEDAQLLGGSPDAEPQGYGTQAPADLAEADLWLEQGQQDCDLALPDALPPDRSRD